MKIKFEVLVSITAMITAVAAVVVAIVQTQVMQDEADMERQHARLSVLPSVLPYLQSHIGNDNGKSSIGLINQGIGPAVIEGFSITLNGEKYYNWASFISNGTNNQVYISGSKRNVESVITNDMQPGMLLPAGDRIVPLSLGTTTEVAALLREMNKNLEVTVCYCSLFKECWSVTDKAARPEPVKSCTAYKDDFFINELGAQE